jgi:DMSO reductase anchor subunit
MHPALSVIFFTTASGAGYGVLVWLGLLTVLGVLPATAWFGVPAIVVALALVTVGLLSSTLHLGRPERAWRAVSQWRSSWLSREGLSALITYIPACVFGLAWLIAGRPTLAAVIAGLLAAVMAVVTVICTAMIYASLRPIRQWHNKLVPPVYLLFSLFTGAICLGAIAAFFDHRAAVLLAALAILVGIGAFATKLAYWRSVDTAPAISTPESATGLGKIGKVHLLEAPHTEENYLLREMGYRIARKHAASLRKVALAGGGALPLALLLVSIPLSGVAGAALLIVAAVLALVGMLVERWLFFAEATHTVVLYYGRAA